MRDTTTLTVACSSWRQWSTPYHECSHRGTVSNCKLHQHQRRWWNARGVTSDNSRVVRTAVTSRSTSKTRLSLDPPLYLLRISLFLNKCYVLKTHSQNFWFKSACKPLAWTTTKLTIHAWSISRKVTIRETSFRETSPPGKKLSGKRL